MNVSAYDRYIFMLTPIELRIKMSSRNFGELSKDSRSAIHRLVHGLAFRLP